MPAGRPASTDLTWKRARMVVGIALLDQPCAVKLDAWRNVTAFIPDAWLTPDRRTDLSLEQSG